MKWKLVIYRGAYHGGTGGGPPYPGNNRELIIYPTLSIEDLKEKCVEFLRIFLKNWDIILISNSKTVVFLLC